MQLFESQHGCCMLGDIPVFASFGGWHHASNLVSSALAHHGAAVVVPLLSKLHGFSWYSASKLVLGSYTNKRAVAGAVALALSTWILSSLAATSDGAPPLPRAQAYFSRPLGSRSPGLTLVTQTPVLCFRRLRSLPIPFSRSL